MNDKRWARGTPARLLMLDDDAAHAQLLGGWLTQRGFQLTEAPSATRVRELVAQCEPELVVVGLDQNGGAPGVAVRRLREVSAQLVLPIIVILRHPDPKLEVALYDDGASAVVARPLDYSALMALLRSHLAQSRMFRSTLMEVCQLRGAMESRFHSMVECAALAGGDPVSGALQTGAHGFDDLVQLASGLDLRARRCLELG